MSVEKFDNSDYAMTHCGECGVELTDEEKKYYICICKKCEKKLLEERVRLEWNEAKRQAMVDAAYKYLEEITKKPLNFESEAKKQAGTSQK